jgi:uncharacterized lipoprotein YehR (DUF1307 family)
VERIKSNMKIKIANCGEVFQDEAKKYVVNMQGNRRMLHIKNGCYHGEFLYKYIDFDTLEEAEKYPKNFAKCEICFGNKNL